MACIPLLQADFGGLARGTPEANHPRCLRGVGDHIDRRYIKIVVMLKCTAEDINLEPQPLNLSIPSNIVVYVSSNLVNNSTLGAYAIISEHGLHDAWGTQCSLCMVIGRFHGSPKRDYRTPQHGLSGCSLR